MGLYGLHGMGGIGKTTIAQGIFNKLFREFGTQCQGHVSFTLNPPDEDKVRIPFWNLEVTVLVLTDLCQTVELFSGKGKTVTNI